MKPVTMFTMEDCPHCQRARRWMREVFAAHPEYGAVPLTIIDEVEQPRIAAAYEYWYVPTYYVGDLKRHEGVASREIIEAVFQAAFETAG